MKFLMNWFDIREGEARPVIISIFGAFLVVSFLILARSLREALYLAQFDVKTLPYITAAVALLGIPTVGLFSNLMGKNTAKRVFCGFLVLTAVLIGLSWPLVEKTSVALIVFYLVTALGTMLITSGFWVVTSEYFAVRGAKRLFGLISAGGTAGAMITGTSLKWLTQTIEIFWLIPILVAIIMLSLILQLALPKIPTQKSLSPESQTNASSIKKNFKLIFKSQHLKLLSFIIVSATMASTLLDFQFKELVREEISTKEGLASFFGAFYGWTGGISLFVQLFVTSRIMASTGLAWSLAILPLVLLLGSTGLMILPGLFLVTLVRGADNSLRKSLYRATLEVFYVPIPSSIRKKTKTFIDSVLDSGAEGIGAGLIFLWVTLGGLPSKYLSVFVILLALGLVYLSRKMDKVYLGTLTKRLEEGKEMLDESVMASHFEGRDLFTSAITRTEINYYLKNIPSIVQSKVQKTKIIKDDTQPIDTFELLRSNDTVKIAKTLKNITEWSEAHIPYLIRFLANDGLYTQVLSILENLGDKASHHLIKIFSDKEEDFVVRRRIPRLIALLKTPEAENALIMALNDNRFEIRYRSAIALSKKKKQNQITTSDELTKIVYETIREDLNKDRAVWELQKILDDLSDEKDELVSRRIDIRGKLSIEHTFRLLSLIFDSTTIRMAYHGIIHDDEKLKSIALEYLEHVLPEDIRKKLWPFIGDMSEHKIKKALRSVDHVIEDLLSTGVTLFNDAEAKKALKKMLE